MVRSYSLSCLSAFAFIAIATKAGAQTLTKIGNTSAGTPVFIEAKSVKKADGIITAPATDEAFMREYIKEWKRLMKASPRLAVQREP